MIQVLERAFNILELLAAEEPLELKEMAERLELKKPTLCTILKTLVDLGYAGKNNDGCYVIGERFMEAAFPLQRKNILVATAEEAVRTLAQQTRESTIAAIAHKAERVTIARAAFQQGVMVDPGLHLSGNFYTSATGRALLAHMTDAEVEQVVRQNGLPGPEWPEADSRTALRKELIRLRSEKVIIKQSGNDVMFLAVPVLQENGRAWMSLGISIPVSRFTGEHRKEVLKHLSAMGRRTAGELAVALDREALS